LLLLLLVAKERESITGSTLYHHPSAYDKNVEPSTTVRVQTIAGSLYDGTILMARNDFGVTGMCGSILPNGTSYRGNATTAATATTTTTTTTIPSMQSELQLDNLY
jgi:hypothetical protein